MTSADIWFIDTASAHVPNLKSMDSLLDLLATCSISVLSNVLDFETYCYPIQDPGEDDSKKKVFKLGALYTDDGLTSYQDRQMELFDYNSQSPDDRAGCVYVRGLALDMLTWLAENYSLVEPSGRPVADTYNVLMNNLCHHAYMIWLAKKKAVDEEVVGAPHCTLSALERQLRGLFHDGTVAHSLLDKKLNQKSESETLMYMNFTGWTFIRRSKIKIRHNCTPMDIIKLGMTPLDDKYATGCLNNFDVAKVT